MKRKAKRNYKRDPKEADENFFLKRVSGGMNS